MQAEVPRVNTTRYGLKSFRYEATRIWNNLSNEIRKADSYKAFHAETAPGMGRTSVQLFCLQYLALF